MQTIDFIQTAKWIKAQFSEETIQALFHRLSYNREPDEGVTIETPIIEATYELAAIREKLLNHPFAPDALQAFGLEELMRPEFPLMIARKVAEVQRTKPVTPVEMHEKMSELDRLLYPARDGWKLFQGCIEPLERLVVPQEVTNEQPFDDILTLELSYGSNLQPTLNAVFEILNNVDKLYGSLARLYGFAEYSPLRVIYADSGSSFRFDFKGLGEPIKRIKELLVEGWNLIRHRKIEDFRRNNQALLESLESVRQIQSLKREGVLENEEAMRLKEQVLDSVTNLFEAGVLPREVPESEYVPNYKLLEEYHRKLLPPAPEQLPARASRKKATRTGKARTSKKR